MPKIYTALIITVLLLVGCVASPKILPAKNYVSGGDVLNDADTWDFGQISSGEVLKHVFVIKNNSTRNMHIRRIDTSCGCTASQVDKKNLLPGESALLEVNFNSRDYRGQVKQYVYVQTDNLDNPIQRFIIKADVR